MQELYKSKVKINDEYIIAFKDATLTTEFENFVENLSGDTIKIDSSSSTPISQWLNEHDEVIAYALNDLNNRIGDGLTVQEQIESQINSNNNDYLPLASVLIPTDVPQGVAGEDILLGTVGATAIKLHLPDDNDTKVTQTNVTTAGNYPIILKNNNNTTDITETVKYNGDLNYNPSTKVLTAPTANISKLNSTTITGSTINSDDANVDELIVTAKATLASAKITTGTIDNLTVSAATGTSLKFNIGTIGTSYLATVISTSISAKTLTVGNSITNISTSANENTDSVLLTAKAIDTKINNKLTNAVNLRGATSWTNLNNITNASVGDLYLVAATDSSNNTYEYIWDGTKWEKIGAEQSFVPVSAVSVKSPVPTAEYGQTVILGTVANNTFQFKMVNAPTDEKVKQTLVTSAGNYPIILKNTTNTSDTITDAVKYNSELSYNPSAKIFNVPTVQAKKVNGSTINGDSAEIITINSTTGHIKTVNSSTINGVTINATNIIASNASISLATTNTSWTNDLKATTINVGTGYIDRLIANVGATIDSAYIKILNATNSHLIEAEIATANISTAIIQHLDLETATANIINATTINATNIPGFVKDTDLALSEEYLPSDKVNEELEPQKNDTYEEAISKLHKAVLDNEMISAAAFNNLENRKVNYTSVATVALSGNYSDLQNIPENILSTESITGTVATANFGETTIIATISGTEIGIYLPVVDTEDVKVTQTNISTNGNYPIILKYNTDTATVTDGVNYNSSLNYNPGTKVLTVPTANIDKLDVTTGTIDTLNSTSGKITTATVTTGYITTLNATTGNIKTINASNILATTATAINLKVTTGTIDTLNSTSSKITTATVTTGYITTLNATTGNIKTVNATNINGTTITGSTIVGVTANIKTINATNILATTATVINIKATNGTIDTLNSTNATITNLKATTGTISTLNSTNANISTATVTAIIATDAKIVNATTTNLKATNGTIDKLNSTSATITTATVTNLKATTGTIDALNSTNATVTNLKATNGTIDKLNSTSATITTATVTNLKATTGTINELNSTSGKITTATVTTGHITTLNATTGNIKTVNATNIYATTITGSTIVGVTSNIKTINATNILATTATVVNIKATNATIDKLNSTNATITTATVTTGYITTINATTGNIKTVNATNIYATTINADNIPGFVKFEDLKLSTTYQMSASTNTDLTLVANDSYEIAFGKIHKAIADDEEVIAAALNDLNNKKADIDALSSISAESISLSNEYAITSITGSSLEPAPNDSIQLSIAKLHKSILDIEYVIAAALNDINARLNKLNI